MAMEERVYRQYRKMMADPERYIVSIEPDYSAVIHTNYMYTNSICFLYIYYGSF